ncbi:MAG: endolytic transglycosylase MltG, partial [Desulfobacteraceae bacterium]
MSVAHTNPQKRFTRKRLAIISLGLLFLAGLFLCAALGLFYITPAEKQGKNQLVIVKEGLSLKEVAGELDRKKIITSKVLFELWAELLGYSRKIKAGEYELGGHMAPKRILEKLIKGKVITYPVTVPEGFTAAQISELLHEGGLINKERFLSLINDPTLLKHHGISAPSLEGYLYPETYHFARGISARSTIDAMVGRFWQVVSPLKGRMDRVGMKLPELITLASIVEKETGLAEERPTIASVFLNRLKKGMRLESDP